MSEPNDAPRPVRTESDSASPAPSAASTASMLQFKRSQVYSVLIPLAFVTGLAVGFLFWGRQAQPVPETLAADPAAATPAAPTRLQVSVDDDPSIGPANAPITIIEFSDFNCPYCKKWQAETFAPLMAAYENKIRFVYRDFPITSQESTVAAEAADCAAEQGSYWPFHNALLTGELGLGREAYQQYAQRLGLNAEALLACIDSGKYADEVEKDARYAASLGVSGTPTFFINGLPLVGAQPLSQFQRIIDEELKGP